MSARVQLDMVRLETPEVKDAVDYSRGPAIDLKRLCRRENLKYIQYREYYPNQEHLPEDQREYRMAYFLHEQFLEIGLKFYSKRQLAEAVSSFSVYRMVPRNRRASLVAWGGARSLKIVTVMSEEKRKEREKQRAEQEAMREASKAGELENLKAGRGKVKAVADGVAVEVA